MPYFCQTRRSEEDADEDTEDAEGTDDEATIDGEAQERMLHARKAPTRPAANKALRRGQDVPDDAPRRSKRQTCC